MIITEEYVQEQIGLAFERFLLILPETIGNLINNHMTKLKINEKFYKDHPEFTDKREIVASVVEKVEGENPFEDNLDKIFDKAVPEIKKRVALVGTLDMENVSKTPNRDFSDIDIDSSHGVI